MKIFLDTSVLVAAFWAGHPNHRESLNVLASSNKKRAACGLHTLAEVYATMTVLPIKEILPPDQVLLFVQEIRDRCNVISLDESEYLATIEDAAKRGLRSGRIYDALLLQCAAKSHAEKIYTWNVNHFRSIAPGLAGRIVTP